MGCHTFVGLLLAAFCSFSSYTFASVTTTIQTIYFQPNLSSLSETEKEKLKQFVKQLPSIGEVEITVAGHTDNEGNTQYNQTLSVDRSLAVGEELIALGVTRNTLHLAHFGESKPISNNLTESGKAKNRRVDITVTHILLNSLKDLVNADSLLSPQVFKVNTKQSQVIIGKKGMEITIPKDAFVDLIGKELKSNNVTLMLTEFTATTEAFFHGITTMSDKGILESGGMYNLEAFADGNPLQLGAGKELKVKIPSLKSEPDMKVYISTSDTQGKLVWKETSAAFSPIKEPVDTRTYQLDYNKYKSFLASVVEMPTPSDIPTIQNFGAKKPEAPIRPKLKLQEQKTLNQSGISGITKNKKEQQKILQKMNQSIKAANEKRTLKYEQQLEKYLVDSASFSSRNKAFLTAKIAYIDHIQTKLIELNALLDTYKQAVVKKRLIYFINTLVDASEKNMLYNSNLIQRCKYFCTNEPFMFRDFEFEKSFNLTYSSSKQKEHSVFYKGCFWVNGIYNNSEYFYSVSKEPIANAILNQLVADNPFLTVDERKLQVAMINSFSPNLVAKKIEPNSFYQATIGQLGYVNCDRIYTIENATVLEVDNLKKQAESVAFIKGVNASQPIYVGKNSFKKNEDIILLSVYFENGKPLVAYKEVRLNSTQKISLEYKEMKSEEFKQLVLSII